MTCEVKKLYHGLNRHNFTNIMAYKGVYQRNCSKTYYYLLKVK